MACRPRVNPFMFPLYELEKIHTLDTGIGDPAYSIAVRGVAINSVTNVRQDNQYNFSDTENILKVQIPTSYREHTIKLFPATIIP
jgi:hypothetical protein